MKRTTVSERVLILAPHGRDAAVAVNILGEAEIEAEACASLAALALEMDRGAAAAVITEEALHTADLPHLAAWLADQAEWSDFPFVLLTGQGGGLERNPSARRYLEVLGNVSLIERPFHPATLVSLVRAALRARRRQYEARARLEALREGESRLRLATENAEVGFWDVDVINDVLVWPPRVKAMFGISPDVPVTMADFYAGLHPDDRDATTAAFQAACDPQVRALYDTEYRTVGKEDGLIRWVAAKGRGLFDDQGRCKRVVGIAVDISARRVAETALRESEERFRNIADFAPVMIWVTDAEGNCSYLNRPWFEFTGQISADAEGFGWLDPVHPDDRGWSEETFRNAVRQREAFRFEYRLRRSDGAYRWAIASASPRWSAAGEFLGHIGSVVDIHERKAAEAELENRVAEAMAEHRRLEDARREADVLYRTYFENTPEALFIIGVEPDGGFVIEETNASHEAGIGMKLADVQGKRIDQVLPEEMASQIIATYQHVVDTGAMYQYRELFELNGVSEHWDTALVPMRDESGRIVRLIGSSRNVSPQIQAEEALRQAQKMEAIGQLTGGVAHDFNNLLTPIIGSLDRLQRQEWGDERHARLIDGAMQSAERARTLVQRLLAFARRQPLQTTPVDIGALIEGMSDLIGSTLGPRVPLSQHIADDLPPAMVDANQIEMAILNLAVNARDAMPNGGALTIGTDLVDVGNDESLDLQPGQYIRVRVSDTGLGMDEATRARAVEPFFSTKGIGQGTGLGLSMVHGVAAQLGGALSIASTLGHGTQIDLYLPVSDQIVRQPNTRAEPTDVRANGKVLLVDDEILIRMSTSDLLSDLGYEVIEAGSAEGALALAAEGCDFDMLITDHLMPGMSGIDLADTLRKDRPGLPVLIISGYADLEGVAADIPRLVKPFRLSELADKLKQLEDA